MEETDNLFEWLIKVPLGYLSEPFKINSEWIDRTHAFNFAEYQDPENTVTFAKSILVAVPLSLTFFIPFLFAGKIMDIAPEGFGFWVIYGIGLGCLTVSYFIHQWVIKII